MSLLFTSLPPTLVAATGGVILAGLPFAKTYFSGTASLALLQGVNVAAFALNCWAVSVPGRIDGPQDQTMRRGDLNPHKPTDAPTTTTTTRQQQQQQDNNNETTPLATTTDASSTSYDNTYSPARGRTMVSPSGWAFSIWGPIYVGEAVFCAAQLLVPQSSGLATILPQVTAPLVAAHLFQTLWCASFRPSYQDWASYISPLMLAGTAFSLSQVHAVAMAAAAAAPPSSSCCWWLWPMTLHFGWTTAATLVNLNGSIAMDSSNNNTDRIVTAAGHASAVVATALGVGVTLAQMSPTYGGTVAWALAACADGMRKRAAAFDSSSSSSSSSMKTAVSVQEKLCWAGAGACALSAVATFFI